jgi:hypothetical protein
MRMADEERAEKGTKDGLYRLSMQDKARFGRLMQVNLGLPGCIGLSGGCVRFHALVPDRRRFHLHRFQAVQEGWRKMIEPIHTCCFSLLEKR